MSWIDLYPVTSNPLPLIPHILLCFSSPRLSNMKARAFHFSAENLCSTFVWLGVNSEEEDSRYKSRTDVPYFLFLSNSNDYISLAAIAFMMSGHDFISSNNAKDNYITKSTSRGKYCNPGCILCYYFTVSPGLMQSSIMLALINTVQIREVIYLFEN